MIVSQCVWCDSCPSPMSSWARPLALALGRVDGKTEMAACLGWDTEHLGVTSPLYRCCDSGMSVYTGPPELANMAQA